MQSPGFEAAYIRLQSEMKTGIAALMCAEENPKNCHRYLLSDLLTARGYQVFHLLGPNLTETHSYTPGIQITGLTVAYPHPNRDIFTDG